MEFIPYKANEWFEHLYYQIPMELFFNPKYKDKLNSDSKILYGFLLNRLTLSARNNWVDEDEKVIIENQIIEISNKIPDFFLNCIQIISNIKAITANICANIKNIFYFIPSSFQFLLILS